MFLGDATSGGVSRGGEKRCSDGSDSNIGRKVSMTWELEQDLLLWELVCGAESRICGWCRSRAFCMKRFWGWESWRRQRLNPLYLADQSLQSVDDDD